MSKNILKLHLDIGNVTAMGPSKVELLELIIETGSISKAAKKMNMSYRTAWIHVNTMNQCFKQPLVIGVIGGRSGGGATVTDFGKSILEAYQTIFTKINEIAAKEINLISSQLE